MMGPVLGPQRQTAMDQSHTQWFSSGPAAPRETTELGALAGAAELTPPEDFCEGVAPPLTAGFNTGLF